MVGIISGNGLGLFNSSLDVLGLAEGQTGIGQANGKAYANIATGNLSVQFLDESLAGTGADLFALRTYNSLGTLNDGDADGWRWSGEKRIAQTGVGNSPGSTIIRTLGDGSKTIFDWNGSAYVSNGGSGAFDTITWTGSDWLYHRNGSDLLVERYDTTSGWIKSLRDSSGNGFDYTFSGDKLSKVKDLKSGQTQEFIYGSNGKLARIDTRTTATGSLTQQVYYSYDSSLRLSSVTTDLDASDNNISDGKVYTTNYTYDGTSNRIASIAQSDGTSVSFTYYTDGTNRLKTVTDQTGTNTFSYDLSSKTTIVKNGNGDNWAYTYDASGQLVKSTSSFVNGNGKLTQYSYDSAGNVKSVTDGRGNILTYTYDANGNPTKEVDMLGNTITRTYGTANQLLTQTSYVIPSLTSPGGEETTRFAYDSAGRLRFVISPAGRVNETVYSSLGLVIESRQYGGGTYSVSGLAASDSLSETQLTNWVSNLIATQKAQIQITSYEYDYRGNLSRKNDYSIVSTSGAGVLDKGSTVTKYIYNEYGQLLQSFKLDSSNVETLLSSFSYDGLGRLESSSSRVGGTNRITNCLNIAAAR